MLILSVTTVLQETGKNSCELLYTVYILFGCMLHEVVLRYLFVSYCLFCSVYSDTSFSVRSTRGSHFITKPNSKFYHGPHL